MLSEVDPSDGMSLRETLEMAWSIEGVKPSELDGPECPYYGSYLWEWYLQLRRRSAGTGFGAAPITWEAIDAWARRSGIDPAPWELEILESLDAAYLKQQAAEQKKNDQRRSRSRN
jgi:hypothetical protein